MPSKKLLVADDSLTIQKVIRLALSNEGYEIQAVSDGNDAIQQILLFRPDVVLVDVSLPGKSAFELKREANHHPDLQDVRFVLMSSAFEKVDENQVVEVHFHGRLTKPFDPAHLREVLSTVFAQVEAKRMEPTTRITRPSFTPPPPPPEEDLDHMISEPAFTPPEPPSETIAEYLEPPSEAEAPASSPESDIRQLTESTIRMSGLDDFEWSVQEPSLKPPSSLLEPDDTTFPNSPQSWGDKDAAAYHSAPEELPEPTTFTPPPLPPRPSVSPTAPPHGPQATQAKPTGSGGVPTQELEELVRREIQKVLPQIAEKILKEEIHRMLSERP